MKRKNSKLLLIAAVILLAVILFNSFAGEQPGSALGTVSDIVEIIDSGDLSEIIGDIDTALPEQHGDDDKSPADDGEDEPQIDEDGVYDSKDQVALYIHTYGKLPKNYVSKKDAEKAGWSGGSVERYLPGKCISGGRFGNREGLLPDKDGRQWTECDIGTLGQSSRGAKRIVFSNDGLIYYTDDHYESFELLYGEP